MKTRRSWRNQDKLYKDLAKQGYTPAKPVPVPLARCFDCRSYPKQGRARGKCALKGETVNGGTAEMPCFVRRGQKQ
jgi:hypothetical protein